MLWQPRPNAAASVTHGESVDFRLATGGSGTYQNAPADSVESWRGKRYPSGACPGGNIARRCGLRLDAHLPTLYVPPRYLLAARTILWTAFPPRANVGYKLCTAAWSRILRPTRKCGPCGFRWPRHGRSSLKRRSGYSREGQGARMVTAQDKAKSQLEAPPTRCSSWQQVH
jgi:hypothetical protein